MWVIFLRFYFVDAEDVVDTNVIVKDNSTCTHRNTEPNVATFLDDERIVEPVSEFPAGTILVNNFYSLPFASSYRVVVRYTHAFNEHLDRITNNNVSDMMNVESLSSYESSVINVRKFTRSVEFPITFVASCFFKQRNANAREPNFDVSEYVGGKFYMMGSRFEVSKMFIRGPYQIRNISYTKIRFSSDFFIYKLTR